MYQFINSITASEYTAKRQQLSQTHDHIAHWYGKRNPVRGESWGHVTALLLMNQTEQRYLLKPLNSLRGTGDQEYCEYTQEFLLPFFGT